MQTLTKDIKLKLEWKCEAVSILTVFEPVGEEFQAMMSGFDYDVRL